MPTNKPKVSAILEPEDYQLLIAYCNEMGLTQSKAISKIIAVVFKILYDGEGKRISNLDNLTTKNKLSIGDVTEGKIIAKLSEEDYQLLQANLIKILNEIQVIDRRSQQLSHEAKQDSLRILGEIIAFKQVVQDLWQNILNSLHPIQDGIQKLTKIFRV